LATSEFGHLAGEVLHNVPASKNMPQAFFETPGAARIHLLPIPPAPKEISNRTLFIGTSRKL
jgi:hypothetical protein